MVFHVFETCPYKSIFAFDAALLMIGGSPKAGDRASTIVGAHGNSL
jgi:hypothetical protein